MQRRTPWRVVSLLPAPTCLHDRYPSVNPALLAVGYDNEVGDRYMSYSAADRLRFIEWLRAKYGTIEALNRVDLLQ